MYIKLNYPTREKGKLRYSQQRKIKANYHQQTPPPLKIIRTRGSVSRRKELSPKRKEIQEGIAWGVGEWQTWENLKIHQLCKNKIIKMIILKFKKR